MARRQIVHKNKTPLILVGTEGGKGSAEYNYLRNFRSRNLRIEFSTGNSTDPRGMLNDLIKYINNEDIKSEENCKIFLIIDTDLSNDRINEIKDITSECSKYNIEIITSAPTFEIWYLMHFRNKNLKFSNSKEVKKEIEKIINEPYYASTNMHKIVHELSDIACNNALKIEKQAQKNKEELIKCNPHSSIYKVLEVINNLKDIN